MPAPPARSRLYCSNPSYPGKVDWDSSGGGSILNLAWKVHYPNVPFIFQILNDRADEINNPLTWIDPRLEFQTSEPEYCSIIYGAYVYVSTRVYYQLCTLREGDTQAIDFYCTFY